MSKIQIGDFPFGQDEYDALQRVIASGRISEWKECRAFEEEFADWLGTKYCVIVSSGTAALMCGLQAMMVRGELKQGSRVLIPALTFIATANAVTLCGLEPVFGDIDCRTLCLHSSQVLWKQADMVLPVHLMGYYADMDTIVQYAGCGAPEMKVAEDAAEAHGSNWKGKKAGTFGLWSAFSFYIAHTVQAGEMGCVCTDDLGIATTVRSLKAHGRACSCLKCRRKDGECPHLEDGDPRFTSLFPGYNFKTMEFQAALARVQLRHIDWNIEQRKRNVQNLTEYLSPLEGLINPFYVQPGAVHMAYPIVLQREGIRNRVLVELERRGVECRPLFLSIPTQQPAYRKYREEYDGRLPIADYYGANGLYVGCHQYLTDEQIKYMADTLVDVITELSDD